MKIAIIDHLGNHISTKDIESGLVKMGHEVRWNMYYDPKDLDWCDVALFAWAEGMVHRAIKDGWGEKRALFVWMTDIELWHRQYHGIDFSKLAGLFYMSEGIFDVMDKEYGIREKYPRLPCVNLPVPIDLSQWTFKSRGHGKHIAVVGQMWPAKNPNIIPLIANEVGGDYIWHVHGKWKDDGWRWMRHQFDHEVKELGLTDRIIVTEDKVDSMDQWLEEKNYLVTFSLKDAFSKVVAEAMAKGIKAIPHNFLGSNKIWRHYAWSTIDDLKIRLSGHYDSEQYLAYIAEHFSTDTILPKLVDRFFEAKR